MSKHTYYIGMESSNGYVKSTSSVNVGEVDTYLNTLTTIKDPNVYLASQSRIENLDHKVNRDKSNDVYEIIAGVDPKPTYYKVGQRPTTDDIKGFSEEGTSKYSRKEWIAANLIAVYRQLENEDFRGCTINLVTGLPTNHSVDTELKQDIINSLTKTYTVNGRNLRISNVSILPQADSSFFNDLLDFEGKLNEEFLNDVTSEDEDQQTTILYYDIGYGTTDVKTVVDFAIDPIRKKELAGMEKQFVDMMDVAIGENALLADAELLLVEKQLRKHGNLDVDGIKVDIVAERNEILERFAEEIVDVIEKAPFKKMKINEHRFVGGGAIIMEDYVMKALKNKYVKNKSQIDKYKFIKGEDENYLQFTNCLGFYKMCVKKYSK
ncbi:hypothetical protein AKG34_21305 [Peribacillus butanolivorans]|uniref:ParM/StbA family protein n=1 Tax=Peribacillus butanolivorans TaxID=421767 RepID=UPI0006A6B62C|nr:hypothetical protein [Peribacillus butanolivorans]KON67360.1 hypothetical protein AKG34_21305 [Peribacillus butanolivorans]